VLSHTSIKYTAKAVKQEIDNYFTSEKPTKILRTTRPYVQKQVTWTLTVGTRSTGMKQSLCYQWQCYLHQSRLNATGSRRNGKVGGPHKKW